jgi:pyruvate dehydrogenase E2 component (dihydrolipoyllysine-residue acetyltransferase)
MAEFVMPILGADMTAGTLIAWRKQVGDRVSRGDIIAEVETEKGLIDVEVFVSGVVERIVVEPGASVPTGAVLALIREDAEVAAPPPSPKAPEARPPVTLPAEPSAPSIEPRGTRTGRVRVSPLARKLAAQLGIDPTALRGSGAGGAVTREDVEHAAQRTSVTASPVSPGRRGPDVATMRHAIAVAMARSKREIPHYYLAHTIDLHRPLTWLAEENAKRAVDERLLTGVLLIKAVALALREVPELNGYWRDGRSEPSPAVHVGVAISLRGGGLVAPALHDTDRRPLGDLMRALRDLTQRARGGGLRSSELSDPTITVTSLGERGVETVFGIVYPPQVAIVGFGKITDRPWLVDAAVVSRPLVTATLSADHRVSDGHRGGLFLAAVERLLQAPERL